MKSGCFAAVDRDQDAVIGSNRRAGLRAFWLAHAHLFEPAFGSADVARKFLDSLVYRDELQAVEAKGTGIVHVKAEVTYYGGGGGTLDELTLEKPAKAVACENAGAPGGVIVAGSLFGGEPCITFARLGTW